MAEDLIRVIREAVDSLSESVRGEVGVLRHDILTHFDEVYARFDRLESETQALRSGLSRVEERLDSLDVGLTI